MDLDRGPKTPRRLKGLAEQYERDGQKAEAAEAYEQLIEMDATARAVLAPRLVALYAELREPKQSVAWAREVMKRNPYPQEYLAGVYLMNGMHYKARHILEQELAKPENKGREVLLHWQIANVYAGEQNREQAKKHYRAAVDAAEGRPEEAAAQRRLQRFLDSTQTPPE
jgi:tetratricopeptide (TPR) repeat protein